MANDERSRKSNFPLGLVWLAAAAGTIVPNAGASKVSVLAYESFCTFAPVSTVILVALAVTAFVGSKPKGGERTNARDIAQESR